MSLAIMKGNCTDESWNTQTEISLFHFHRALVSSNYQLRSPVLIRPTPSAETKTPLNQTKIPVTADWSWNSTGSPEKLRCDLFNMEEKSYPEKNLFLSGLSFFFFFSKDLGERGKPPDTSGNILLKSEFSSQVIIVLMCRGVRSNLNSSDLRTRTVSNTDIDCVDVLERSPLAPDI